MTKEKKAEKGKQNKVLVIGSSWDKFGGSFLGDTKYWKYDLNSDIVGSLAMMLKGNYDALLIEKDFFNALYQKTQYSQEKSVLENLPVGLALVDDDHKILWFNRQFRDWCEKKDDLVGQKFYDPLGRPELRGPDFCPFRTVRMKKIPSFTTFYQDRQKRFLSMGTAPVLAEDGKIASYLVELHDITDQNREEIVGIRLREAGRELTDLSREDVEKLSPEERVNILRAKIAKYAKEILNFDTIEIRLLSKRTYGLLEPLLAIGMTDEAKQRVLYASQDDNGITGWVAYHGKSYRMEDRAEDIFYIEGIPGARSSITVPLKYHGKVIGTFNVESQHPNAFSVQDLHLLESYAEDVAAAIHTLDLLNFEHQDSAFRSLETVYGDSVAPLNHILNESARLLQGDLSDREDICNSLIAIQNDVREIQKAFRNRSDESQPELPSIASEVDCRNFEILRDKRILLIDSDPSMGRQLSRILFFYGCIVETANKGGDALRMLESAYYDVFISDVKLEDMSAYTLFEQIRDIIDVPFPPYIFMTGYGHDGGHVMTKAKVAGVLGYIFKPFILPQLLKNLKLVITESERQNELFVR